MIVRRIIFKKPPKSGPLLQWFDWQNRERRKNGLRTFSSIETHVVGAKVHVSFGYKPRKWGTGART